MKTFAGMPIEKAQQKIQESRKRWEGLKKTKPKEYKQKIEVADRWQAETDAMTQENQDEK